MIDEQVDYEQVRQILAADMTSADHAAPLPELKVTVGGVAFAVYGLVQEVRQLRAANDARDALMLAPAGTPIDDGSAKPLGYTTPDGYLQVRESVDKTGTPFRGYHETELGAHQRWMRSAPELFEKYVELQEFRARAQKADGFLEREGYRRCDIPACNCGSWHLQNGRESVRADDVWQSHLDQEVAVLRDIAERLSGYGLAGLVRDIRECSDRLLALMK